MSKIKVDEAEERKAWDNFKKVWESYGVKFQREDGKYKSTYEVLKEMSVVWGKLQEEEKRGIKEWNLFK